MTREEIMDMDVKAANLAAARYILGWTRRGSVVIGDGRQSIDDAWTFTNPLNGTFMILPVSMTPDFFDKKNSYILVDGLLRRGLSVLIGKLQSLEDGTEQWKVAVFYGETFTDADAVVLPTAQDAVLRAGLLKTARD
jgi:hypothetical protein